MRSKEKSLFRIGLFTNKYLLASILLGILIQFLIIIVPFFAQVFNVFTLNVRDWILVTLISLIPFIVNELFKLIKYRK